MNSPDSVVESTLQWYAREYAYARKTGRSRQWAEALCAYVMFVACDDTRKEDGE